MINKINLALTALAFLVLVIYLEGKTSTEKFEIKSPYYMTDLDTYSELIKSLKVDNLVYDKSLDEYPRLDKYGSRMIFPKMKQLRN